MDSDLRGLFDDVWSSDRARQNAAFSALMQATEELVPWADDVWDEALANLTHRDNHNRAIAAQLLCNLAKSDPQQRMLTDLPALLEVTKDDRFVTARHCLQALWKVGAAGDEQRRLLLEGMETRFDTCLEEKNWSLIRFDILQGMRNLYDQTGSDDVKRLALELISRETDPKYQKKYAGAWRGA